MTRLIGNHDDRTHACRGERGQTLQDYTIGISLFIITIAAAVAGIFGFVGPASPGVSAEDIAQSERISTAMVQNLSTGQQPNELRADDLRKSLDRPISDLRGRWGVESSTNLNVTVEVLNGSVIVENATTGSKLTAGSAYADHSAGTTTRIVTVDEPRCTPACRLVVRAW